MLSTNCGIHRNEGLNAVPAITNVLERTDKLIKDYRFFFIIRIVRYDKDNVKIQRRRKCSSYENQ
ncbi:hypothetical protein ABIC22_002452 [Paenibacillus sp. PvP094]